MKRDNEKGSGNVFADLGFRDSKQELRNATRTNTPADGSERR